MGSALRWWSNESSYRGSESRSRQGERPFSSSYRSILIRQCLSRHRVHSTPKDRCASQSEILCPPFHKRRRKSRWHNCFNICARRTATPVLVTGSIAKQNCFFSFTVIICRLSVQSILRNEGYNSRLLGKKVVFYWCSTLKSQNQAVFRYTLLHVNSMHGFVNHCHNLHRLSLNCEGRWGTIDDFATSFRHFPLFSAALWDLPNSRPVY